MSVDKTTLEAKVREGTGKGVARKLRAQGLVPAVIYGKHLEQPRHVAVDPKSVRQAINTPHKFNTLITVKTEAGEQEVLFKDYQQDPLTREMLHVDFIAVREDEQVKVNVPLVLTGKAEGVVAGGLLTQLRRELEVWVMPRTIPEKIEVDVTGLKVAQAMHINDVKLPEGVTVKTNVNYTLAVISAPEAVEAVAATTPTAAAPATKGGAPAGATKGPASGAAKKK